MSNDANASDVVDFVWVPGEDFVDEFLLEWEESGEAEVFYKEQIKLRLRANAEAKKIEMNNERRISSDSDNLAQMQRYLPVQRLSSSPNSAGDRSNPNNADLQITSVSNFVSEFSQTTRFGPTQRLINGYSWERKWRSRRNKIRFRTHFYK